MMKEQGVSLGEVSREKEREGDLPVCRDGNSPLSSISRTIRMAVIPFMTASRKTGRISVDEMKLTGEGTTHAFPKDKRTAGNDGQLDATKRSCGSSQVEIWKLTRSIKTIRYFSPFEDACRSRSIATLPSEATSTSRPERLSCRLRTVEDCEQDELSWRHEGC